MAAIFRINAGSIVAVPTENSDIRANSVNARGGNVTINTSGIFGIQFRPQDTPLSDITATGASSAQSGTVQLNIEQLDPTSGLVELPTTVADLSRLIVQGCPANEGNSFVISGRGGLPPTPEQQLDDDAKWSDRRRLVVAQQRGRGDTETQGRGDTRRQGNRDTETRDRGESVTNALRVPPSPSSSLLTEATNWQIMPTGAIVLVANASDPSVQNSLSNSTNCHRD